VETCFRERKRDKNAKNNNNTVPVAKQPTIEVAEKKTLN